MSEQKKLVVVITNGFDNERASVAWSIANGGIASGYKVTIFLVASGVDWVRKGATQTARLNPLDPPVGEMMQIPTLIHRFVVDDRRVWQAVEKTLISNK